MLFTGFIYTLTYCCQPSMVNGIYVHDKFTDAFDCLILSSGPSASPLNLRLVDTTATSILVTWDKVPAADQNGIIVSYTVKYQAVGGISVNAPIDTTTFFNSAREANLTDLIKNQNYRISVLASTIKGPGDYSDPITVLTNQARK